MSTLVELDPANGYADLAEAIAQGFKARAERLAGLRAGWHTPPPVGARPEQLPPEGDWRIWYLRGGRGAGKTRTGAETLADWIIANPPDDPKSMREWAIVAPTFGDARAVCAEGISGLIRALGGLEERGGLISAWNRSEGVIRVGGQHVIYLDGANDGAFRIQGKNLSGCWADEVGLWEKWDAAWNESIRFAVRMAPGRIVATGTPKMGHPLIKHLLESPNVVETHMRTIDNAANLDPQALADLQESYGGSTLGLQELEGEFIEALEGEVLPRRAWRWYSRELSFYARTRPFSLDALPTGDALPRFDKIVCSWDTALKDKTSSDFVAGQVWGCKGPDRYLLRLFHGKAALNATVEAMRELRAWAVAWWPGVPCWVLVENASNGPDAIAEMRRDVDGVVAVAAKGDKAQRALAAAVALETGHCWLPGYADTDPGGRGYTNETPGEIQLFVEECSLFRGDLKHRSNDDQVDAWSQMVNWARSRGDKAQGRISRPSGALVRAGSLAVR